MDKKLCAMCNKMFTPKRKDQTYCSVDCRYAYNRTKHLDVKYPPMQRAQALINAYLMDKSLGDLDQLIHEHFERKIADA